MLLLFFFISTSDFGYAFHTFSLCSFVHPTHTLQTPPREQNTNLSHLFVEVASVIVLLFLVLLSLSPKAKFFFFFHAGLLDFSVNLFRTRKHRSFVARATVSRRIFEVRIRDPLRVINLLLVFFSCLSQRL